MRNEYAPCPEDLPIARYRKGIDTTDLLIAAYPTPLLLMAGRLDELFKPQWTEEVADQVAKAYDAGGHKDRFQLFIDDTPHFYTIAQAFQAIGWMDHWVRGIPPRELPKITAEDVEMAPDQVLQCHPRAVENMVSMNREEAERLAKTRIGQPIRAAAMKLVGLDEAGLRQLRPQHVESAKPVLELSTHGALEELALAADNDIQLPATMLYYGDQKTRAGAVLYFDDRGRWKDLGSGGMLADMQHLLVKGGTKPAVLTVDLRGWGDTSPSYAPFEVFPWGAPDRWLGYVSAAVADPVLGMRIRDGLVALAYLKSRLKPIQPGLWLAVTGWAPWWPCTWLKSMGRFTPFWATECSAASRCLWIPLNMLGPRMRFCRMF